MRALLALAMVAACHHAPAVPGPRPIETIDVRRACLHNTTRPAPAVPFKAVTGATCAPWAACYELRDALALAWYLRALERWVDAALIDCGSEPPALPGKGATP